MKLGLSIGYSKARLEIPVALQWMAKSGRSDALVAVGCLLLTLSVVRGTARAQEVQAARV